VRDTGHGMTPQTLERIFEPFFTTKPRGEGTGLGLSAVHGIMQNHGGHIRVTSQPGQGSCFELYFPAHEAGRHDADSIDSQVNRGQGEAVLFVDDEAFLVRLASRLLESLGYTPYATTDAQEALDLVRAQPDRFRVVVTDLTMPGLTGIDLAQELFKISPGLPIILTTGYSADWTEERLKALGLYEILPKPPTREALARAVERALQRRAKEAHGRHPRSATCGVLPPTLKARQSRAPHDSSMSLAPASRRRFLQQSALLIAAPLILPGRVWSQASAPSKRLTIGCIGMGHQMNGHLGNFLNRDDVQVVAVCDVDTTRREYTKKRVNDFYAAKTGTEYKGCDAYNDFRELLARKDIDIAVIATPDHWHAYIAIAAVKAGKDVYCEKPLTYSVREAVELVKAVRSTQRVFQTGSQQRSSKEFRVAAELVRNGVIGKVGAINVSFGDPAKPYAEPVEAMEPGLDWKLWCGPGPLVGYSPYFSPRGVHKHFPHWRNTWEFGGGMITDWGAHHIDIAQWALNADESGPVEIRAPQNWETAKRGAQLIYADGTVLTHIRGRGRVLLRHRRRDPRQSGQVRVHP
jgi:predicted dehydrogenase/CheY-like chemotaxis protein